MEALIKDLLLVEDLLGSLLSREQRIQMGVDLGRDPWYVASNKSVQEQLAIYPPTPQELRVHQREALLSKTRPILASCNLCSRRKHCTTPTPGEGPVNADIFVITDAPGWIDDRTQIPLAGLLGIKSAPCMHCEHLEECYSDLDSQKPQRECTPKFIQHPGNKRFSWKASVKSPGEYFNKIIMRAPTLSRKHWQDYVDLRREEGLEAKDPPVKANLFITNAAKCYVPGSDGNSLPPTSEEIAACKPWLEIERSLVSSPVTICLGQRASEAVLGRKIDTFKDLIGKSEEIENFGTVYFTYHPAYLLYIASGSAQWDQVIKDIAETFTTAYAFSQTTGQHKQLEMLEVEEKADNKETTADDNNDDDDEDFNLLL